MNYPSVTRRRRLARYDRLDKGVSIFQDRLLGSRGIGI